MFVTDKCNNQLGLLDQRFRHYPRGRRRNRRTDAQPGDRVSSQRHGQQSTRPQIHASCKTCQRQSRNNTRNEHRVITICG